MSYGLRRVRSAPDPTFSARLPDGWRPFRSPYKKSSSPAELKLDGRCRPRSSRVAPSAAAVTIWSDRSRESPDGADHDWAGVRRCKLVAVPASNRATVVGGHPHLSTCTLHVTYLASSATLCRWLFERPCRTLGRISGQLAKLRYESAATGQTRHIVARRTHEAHERRSGPPDRNGGLGRRPYDHRPIDGAGLESQRSLRRYAARRTLRGSVGPEGMTG